MQDGGESMKTIYKGHELEAVRDGDEISWTIFRVSDGFLCTDDIADGCNTVKEVIQYMKDMVDAELEKDDPWDEKAAEAGARADAECVDWEEHHYRYY
jgi:hypothetical protein